MNIPTVTHLKLLNPLHRWKNKNKILGFKERHYKSFSQSQVILKWRQTRDLGWLLIWAPISGPCWPFPFSICIFPQVEKLRNNLSREIQNVVPIYPRRDFCLSVADSLICSFIHSPSLPSFMIYYKWGTYVYSCISSNISGKLYTLLNFSKMKSKVSHLSLIYIYIYIYTYTYIYTYICSYIFLYEIIKFLFA